jgi:hypothetical protein
MYSFSFNEHKININLKMCEMTESYIYILYKIERPWCLFSFFPFYKNIRIFRKVSMPSFKYIKTCTKLTSP